jgi:hypothetical protein
MAIKLPLFIRNAIARRHPVSLADEVSDLTGQAFHRLNRLGAAMDSHVGQDMALALDEHSRNALHVEANQRYLALFDTLLALQSLADKHKRPQPHR